MNPKVKKVLIVIIGVVVFLFLSVFSLNYFIEKKLKEQIDKVPENVKIQYEKIDVNSLTGSVSIKAPLISIYGKTTDSLNAQIELKNLSIDDVGYWNYLFNDKISIENIQFNKPKVIYYHNDVVKSGSYKDTFKKGLKKAINVQSLEIQDAHVEVYNVSNDSLLFRSDNLDFKIEGVEINPKLKKKAITYKDFKATSHTIFYMLNDYENLAMEHLEVTPGFSKFKGVKLKTKYSKEALSNIIAVERDHMDLAMDSVEIKNQDFGYKQDSLFYFKSGRVDFYQPNFKIYRDKLVEDDLSYKPLYSKILRNLNFSMALKSVYLNNAYIAYTEKVNKDTDGGRLVFSNLSADIKNLGNMYKSGDTVTSAKIKAVFMDNTTINTQWDFDVNNMQDAFVFKAELGKLNAKSMNQFMEPNLKVRLEGEIIKTYFTINGTDGSSQIDLKLKYDDFDVLVLKENGKEKNKFLSSIVNIFVSEDSNDASEDFRHGSKSGVDRTDNKSVFNYLWLNIKAGLLSAMTGSGEKN